MIFMYFMIALAANSADKKMLRAHFNTSAQHKLFLQFFFTFLRVHQASLAVLSTAIYFFN